MTQLNLYKPTFDVSRYKEFIVKHARNLNKMVDDFEKIGIKINYKSHLERETKNFLKETHLDYTSYFGQAKSEIAKEAYRMRKEKGLIKNCMTE